MIGRGGCGHRILAAAGITSILAVFIGPASPAGAQENSGALRERALNACKSMISGILVPILDDATASMGPEMADAEIRVSFAKFNDLSGGANFYFEWERVDVEILPHPTFGFSVFVPAHCYADLDGRKITNVGFFRGNDFGSLDPGAIGRVLDDRAAELIASDQGTSF